MHDPIEVTTLVAKWRQVTDSIKTLEAQQSELKKQIDGVLRASGEDAIPVRFSGEEGSWVIKTVRQDRRKPDLVKLSELARLRKLNESYFTPMLTEKSAAAAIEAGDLPAADLSLSLVGKIVEYTECRFSKDGKDNE